MTECVNGEEKGGSERERVRVCVRVLIYYTVQPQCVACACTREARARFVEAEVRVSFRPLFVSYLPTSPSSGV